MNRLPILDLLMPRRSNIRRGPRDASTILPIDPREQALLDRQRAARGIRNSLNQK